MYFAVVSRPDIAFEVTLLAQFMQNPGRAHWDMLKRVIRYVHTTKDYKLTYGVKGQEYHGFCDADWAGQPNSHSICGYVFIMDGGAVSWSAKKQRVVALSSTEAEYVGTTHAAKELIWGRMLLKELGLPQKTPTILHCDNQGAIALARDNQYHARTKHIAVRFHFIRQAIEEQSLTLTYCPTADNMADMFTKALPHAKLSKLVGDLRLSH